MSDPTNGSTATIGEGTISGNQASIPALIRACADIEDGDKLRWYWEDGELTIKQVISATSRIAVSIFAHNIAVGISRLSTRLSVCR